MSGEEMYLSLGPADSEALGGLLARRLVKIRTSKVAGWRTWVVLPVSEKAQIVLSHPKALWKYRQQLLFARACHTHSVANTLVLETPGVDELSEDMPLGEHWKAVYPKYSPWFVAFASRIYDIIDSEKRITGPVTNPGKSWEGALKRARGGKPRPNCLMPDLIAYLSRYASSGGTIEGPGWNFGAKETVTAYRQHLPVGGASSRMSRFIARWERLGIATPGWWPEPNNSMAPIAPGAFADRVLNGMRPSELFSTTDGRVGVIDMSEVKPEHLRRDWLAVSRIEVRFAGATGAALGNATIAWWGYGQAAPTVVEQSETPEWARAQRLWFMMAVLAGQTDHHLARAHVLAEAVLIALMRNLDEQHPVMKVLYPHVLSSQQINRLGDPLILGPAGILAQGSVLTPEGVHRRIASQAGAIRWRDFKPRETSCPEDRYGEAAQIFWEAIGAHVAEQLSTEFTPEQQMSLDAMGRDLETHAVKFNGRDEASWVGRRIVGDDRRRPTWLVRASRALFPEASAPAPKKREEWVQFCRFVIFHATFVHSWVGNAQFEDGGCIFVAPLGVRDVRAFDSVAAFDEYGPEGDLAGMQMAMAELLAKTDVDTLDLTSPLSNYGSELVRTSLTPRLRRHEVRLRQLGVPLETFGIRVNI